MKRKTLSMDIHYYYPVGNFWGIRTHTCIEICCFSVFSCLISRPGNLILRSPNQIVENYCFLENYVTYCFLENYVTS